MESQRSFLSASCQHCSRSRSFSSSVFRPSSFLWFGAVIVIIVSCSSQARAASLSRELRDPQENSALLRRTRYNYAEALRLSLLFYEAQRSGKLPEDNRIRWRGDSALDDKGINGEDLTGGYYDAGDFVKFVWTHSAASSLLGWGLLEGDKGYQEAGLMSQGLACLKWATDFLIKCHPTPDELYEQVGDFNIDHTYWGRPEEMNMTRPAYKIDRQHPGSDLAAEVSAALAVTSAVFRKQGDWRYADLTLQHAEQLYTFAVTYKGLYKDSMKNAGQFYKTESKDFGDELAWAAAWLYRATNSTKYLQEAEEHYETFKLNVRPTDKYLNIIPKQQLNFWVGHRAAGVQVLLAQLTRKPIFLEAAQDFCEFQRISQCRTPKGLLCVETTGVLAHAANVAFLCLQVANLGLSPEANRALAKQQIDYILGDTGRSFVVGFGHNPPRQPNHAASSCPDAPSPCSWNQSESKGPNPQVLYGALVSGPNHNDYFEDKREEYVFTEVTIDYNAGFQSALASLVDLYEFHDADENDLARPSDTNVITSQNKKNEFLQDVRLYKHVDDTDSSVIRASA